MNIYLNHQAKTVPDAYTVADLLANTHTQAPFAVAVNKTFVPKGRYVDTLLQHNDHVDIVQPVVGG